MTLDLDLLTVSLCFGAGAVGGVLTGHLLGGKSSDNLICGGLLGVLAAVSTSYPSNQYWNVGVGSHVPRDLFPIILAFAVGATAVPLWISLFGSILFDLKRDTSATHVEANSKVPVHIPLVARSAFISYRRDDSLETTGRIYDRLSREYGDGKVFRDLDSMPFGVDFREHIDKRLSVCEICFVVIGPKFVSVVDKSGGRRLDDPRDHVRIEIETALKRNIRVVPLLVGGAAMPSESDLPPSLQPLAYRAGTSIRPDPDFHRDIDRLMAGLKAS